MIRLSFEMSVNTCDAIFGKFLDYLNELVKKTYESSRKYRGSQNAFRELHFWRINGMIEWIRIRQDANSLSAANVFFIQEQEKNTERIPSRDDQTKSGNSAKPSMSFWASLVPYRRVCYDRYERSSASKIMDAAHINRSDPASYRAN